jgi:phage terminase Nu1 subunit (DNA packaging protein)
MEKKLEPMKMSDKLTWNRKELAEVTGRSKEVVDQWIYEGAPCFREGHTYVFERTSMIAWLRARAVNRTGMIRKTEVYDDIFPGIELA